MQHMTYSEFYFHIFVFQYKMNYYLDVPEDKLRDTYFYIIINLFFLSWLLPLLGAVKDIRVPLVCCHSISFLFLAI